MVKIEDMTPEEMRTLLDRVGFGHLGCAREGQPYIVPNEMEHAMQQITRRNPTLTPAINATETDAWGRGNTLALYRIKPEVMDGRKTLAAT